MADTRTPEQNRSAGAVSPPPVPDSSSQQTKPKPRATKATKLGLLVANTPAPNKAVRDTITAAHGTLALGGLLHVAEVPFWYPLALGVVLAIAGAVWANQQHSELGLGVLSGVAVGGWLTWATITSPWSLPCLASLLIGAVSLGMWYGRVRQHSLRRARVTENLKVSSETAAESEQSRQGWQGILERAGCRGAVVESTRALSGQAQGVVVSGKLTDPKFDYDGLSGSLSAIELAADQATEYPIRPGAIQLARGKHATAGQFELRIPTVSVFGEKIAHPISHEPRSIEDPIEIATAADGSRIGVLHGDSAHGMWAGMNDFGKSNLLAVHIFEWTRCVDAATWLICGPDKAPALYKPLLRAWLKGETPNPPIDRFAPNESEAMKLLWDACAGVEQRSFGGSIDSDDDSRWTVTPDKPRIMIAIEEAADYLDSKTQHVMPDGKKYTFSALVKHLVRKGRSAGINLVLLLQGGTMDMTGDLGSAIKKQALYRVAYHAQSTTETNACLATNTARVELGSLDRGEIYLEQRGYERPVLALADYMADSGRSHGLDLAGQHHYRYASEVDAETAAAMPFYAERWTRPEQQEYLARLMGLSVDSITAPASADSSQYEQSSGTVAEEPAPAAEAADSSEFAQRQADLVRRYEQRMEQQQEADLADAVNAAMAEAAEGAENAGGRSVGDLEPNTLRLLSVLRDTTEEEIPAPELRARIAELLGLGAESTEADRQLNTAVRDILGADEMPEHVKYRRTLGGSKQTVWNAAAIRGAIEGLSG